MTKHAYWCIECEGWHWRDSKIGKRHVVFEVAEPLWLPDDELQAWREKVQNLGEKEVQS